MAVSDVEVYNWANDYGGADSNSPAQNDAINNNLDDEYRNIKSVVRKESINKQWERHRGLYGTLAFVDANTFTLTGDRTADFTVGRRIKATVTGPPTSVYGYISASSYSGGTNLTTVDVVLDSGALDSGLSEVQLGAITPTNTAIPTTVLTQGSAPLFATASGTDTYTASLVPAITAYVTGQLYTIKFTNANTGTATLNLNSLGAKTIKNLAGAALSAGNIRAGGTYTLIYDGTDMLLVASTAAATVGARVFNSANISIPNNTDTVLTFDSERYDTSSIHSTVTNTGRLTIPAGEAGKYLVSANVEFATDNSGRRNVSLRVNGTAVIGKEVQGAVSSEPNVFQVSAIWDFAAADYVEVVVKQTSGGSLNVQAASSYSPEFMIHKLQ